MTTTRIFLAPCVVLLTLGGTCVRPAPPAPSMVGSTSPAASAAASPASAMAPAVPLSWRLPERAVCLGSYATPIEQGALGDARLIEASGMVASPGNPEVLWVHNDSGDTARLFAIATDGHALGTLALPNVTAVDFEDLAAGPCPDLSGPCLYVADTGDNKLRREQLVVYAVPEPQVARDHPLADNAEAPFVWIFPLVVPERANIEALVVLPDASAMVLFEKTEAEQARVFRYAAPWTPLFPATVEVTGRVAMPGGVGPLRQITGADLHPSGTRLLLRGYGAVYEVRLDAAKGVTADHLDHAELVEAVTGPMEPQGEAVAYDADGTGIWTVSESPSGLAGPPLHHASCAGGS